MSEEGVTERPLPEPWGDEHGAEDTGGQGEGAGEPAAVPASPSSVTDRTNPRCGHERKGPRLRRMSGIRALKGDEPPEGGSSNDHCKEGD